jgi:hypothetical protein
MDMRTMFSLIRNNFTVRPREMFFLMRHALTLWLMNLETRHQFQANFGDFHRGRNCRPHRLVNPSGEGGAILGEVVLMAKQTDIGHGKILLAGDRNDAKQTWEGILPVDRLVTAGIHEMDHFWNFENDPPASLRDERFGLIISQANLEHLINPYKHVADLAGLLAPRGCMVMQSHLPGFFYHRVPIDCFRFYPDWFEVVASRLGLAVIDKQITVFNITYKFQKP